MNNEIEAAFRQLEAMPLCTAVHLAQHFPRRGWFYIDYITHLRPSNSGEFAGYHGPIYRYTDYNEYTVGTLTLIETEIWLWIVEKILPVQGWETSYVSPRGHNITPEEYREKWQPLETTAIACPQCYHPQLEDWSGGWLHCTRCQFMQPASQVS